MGWLVHITVTTETERDAYRDDFTRRSVFWYGFCFWFRDQLRVDQNNPNYKCRCDLFASWSMIYIYFNFHEITNWDVEKAFYIFFKKHNIAIPSYSESDDNERFESFFVRWYEPICHCLAQCVEIEVYIEDGFTYYCECPHHKRNDIVVDRDEYNGFHKKVRHKEGCPFRMNKQKITERKVQNWKSMLDGKKKEMVNIISAKMISGVRRAKNRIPINIGKFFSNILKGKHTKSAGKIND